MFERQKAKKAIDSALNSIQMNLENNYKDLTISARREAEELLQKYTEKGVLKDSDIAAYRKRLSEYDGKMKRYGHANISSFLKERY